MSTENTVRRATESDIHAIMEIYDGRCEWLWGTKFSDQWATVGEWRYLLRYLIHRGHVRVLVDGDDGRVIGTVTVGTDPDRQFWSDDERRMPALYVSKLATDVHLKGQELGNQLLAWVGRYAASQGIRVLRLDTWKTSVGLSDYYANRGWTHVRTVDLPTRESGSLFERRLDVPPDESPADDPPTGQFAVRTLGLAAARGSEHLDAAARS